MRTLIILFLSLTPLILQAQRSLSMMEKRANEMALKYYNKIVEEDAEAFSLTEVPDKWKKEAAVILAQKIYVAFYDTPKIKILGQKGKSDYKGIARKRIKIQDASAIEEFSEYYFQSSEVVGIEVIKSDGSKEEVNITKAIKVEKDIPDFYKDAYHSETFYKIAIPNLEVGDILDYFKVFSEKTKENISLSTIISSEYPILHNQYTFDVNKTWDFYHRVLNVENYIGLKFKIGGYNGNGEWRKHIRRFEYKGETLPAKVERWDYPYLNSPAIRINANYNAQVSRESNRLKLFPIMKSVYYYGKNKANYNKIKGQLSKLNIKSKSTEEKADLIYRLMREAFFKEVLAEVKSESPEVNSVKDLDFYGMNSAYFTAAFAYALDKQDIPCEFAIATPRANAKVRAVINVGDLYFFVHVPSIEKSYFPISNFNIGGEIHHLFYGSPYEKRAYSEVVKNQSGSTYREVLPESEAPKNKSITTLNISLTDKRSMECSIQMKLSGAYKKYYNNILLPGSAYPQADLIGEEKVIKTQLTDFSEKRQEEIEKYLQSDFEFEALENFTILQYGNTLKQPDLEFAFAFSTDKYINKVGPNFVLDAGQLITDQVQLSKEEIQSRTHPIDVDFAKTIINQITIEIPSDLTVEGLDALNMNVDHEQGSFISKAVFEGNKINITTSKIYKKQHLEVEEWSNLVEMLEAAYNFTQKKIVLKST